jgi:hypothetical protein
VPYVACQEGKQSVNWARQRFAVIITCTKFDKNSPVLLGQAGNGSSCATSISWAIGH